MNTDDLKEGAEGPIEGYVWSRTKYGWRCAPQNIERVKCTNSVTWIDPDTGKWLDRPISKAFERDCMKRNSPDYKYTSPGQIGA